MNIEQLVKKAVKLLSRKNPSAAEARDVDFGVLRTMMMLAAVDGTISQGEMARFWEYARQLKGVDASELDELWKSALTSAGYLALQALMLDKDGMVDEFLRVVEKDFVKKLVPATSAVRKRAYRCLKAVAEADGDYSPIEKACISALVRRIRKAWEIKVATQAVHL